MMQRMWADKHKSLKFQKHKTAQCIDPLFLASAGSASIIKTRQSSGL